MRKELDSSDPLEMQRATALYFIDKLALVCVFGIFLLDVV